MSFWSDFTTNNIGTVVRPCIPSINAASMVRNAVGRQNPDRLLANGVNGVAVAAARRKSGALQWGDLPWESGAKTHRKMMGDCPPLFSGQKNRG
jgi:hypothetical protein